MQAAIEVSLVRVSAKVSPASFALLFLSVPPFFASSSHCNLRLSLYLFLLSVSQSAIALCLSARHSVFRTRILGPALKEERTEKDNSNNLNIIIQNYFVFPYRKGTCGKKARRISDSEAKKGDKTNAIYEIKHLNVTKNHEPSSARIEKPWKLVEGLTFEKSAWPLEKKQEEEEAYEAVRVQREKYAQQVCKTSSGRGYWLHEWQQ